jgi:hypothetical protein
MRHQGFNATTAKRPRHSEHVYRFQYARLPAAIAAEKHIDSLQVLQLNLVEISYLMYL